MRFACTHCRECVMTQCCGCGRDRSSNGRFGVRLLGRAHLPVQVIGTLGPVGLLLLGELAPGSASSGEHPVAKHAEVGIDQAHGSLSSSGSSARRSLAPLVEGAAGSPDGEPAEGGVEAVDGELSVAFDDASEGEQEREPFEAEPHVRAPHPAPSCVRRLVQSKSGLVQAKAQHTSITQIVLTNRCRSANASRSSSELTGAAPSGAGPR